MSPIIADIAVPINQNKTFHYTVPDDLVLSVVVGSRVMVPFGSRRVTGTIVGFPDGTAREGLKKIISITTDSLSPELMKLARWMSDYYLHPLGLAIETMVPRA